MNTASKKEVDGVQWEQRPRDEDFVEHLFVASTHHTLMFFTEKGRCYWMKVYEIPEGDKNTKGQSHSKSYAIAGRR